MENTTPVDGANAPENTSAKNAPRSLDGSGNWMPKKITIEIYDSALSTSPMYLEILQEELQKLLASKGLKILEIKESDDNQTTTHNDRQGLLSTNNNL